MKIYVNLCTAPSHQTSDATADTLAVDVCWVLDDPTLVNTNITTLSIPWTTSSTATTLNSAIKAAAIADILATSGYTVNILTDQMVFLAGFVGL